jgi:hypothetical protein
MLFFVTYFASLAAISFPLIPMCAGSHKKTTKPHHLNTV